MNETFVELHLGEQGHKNVSFLTLWKQEL